MYEILVFDAKVEYKIEGEVDSKQGREREEQARTSRQVGDGKADRIDCEQEWKVQLKD